MYNQNKAAVHIQPVGILWNLNHFLNGQPFKNGTKYLIGNWPLSNRITFCIEANIGVIDHQGPNNLSQFAPEESSGLTRPPTRPELQEASQANQLRRQWSQAMSAAAQ
jgi:hypothetical protein